MKSNQLWEAGGAAFSENTGNVHLHDNACSFSRCVEESQREREKKRFLAAQQEVELELAVLCHPQVLAVHKELVGAPSFINSVLNLISRYHASAEAAIEDTVNEIISMLVMLDNDYMLQRAAELKEAGNRLLCNLQGRKKNRYF